MNNSNKAQSSANSDKSHIREAASDLLNESKKYANELYQEGLNQVNVAEDNVKEYSDQLLKKIQENPLTAVMIAGGIGFLLSKILRK